MIHFTPEVWTEIADYVCRECGHKGEGDIELEETGAAWHDLVCEVCESDDLEMGLR